MADVLLVSDDLTVLGGPATVNVEIDYGPSGDRGSLIYAVNGNPNSPSTVLPDDINIFDICINLSAYDDEYLYFYQYLNSDGVDSWTRLFKLDTNTYSKNYINASSKTFDASGNITLTVPLIDIVPSADIPNYTAANFNIHISVHNTTNPVVISTSIGEISGQSLPISVHAVEFDGTSWSNLTGQYPVHLFITVV